MRRIGRTIRSTTNPGVAEIIIDPDAITIRADLCAALQRLHRQRGLSYNELAASSQVPTTTLHDTVTVKSFPTRETLGEILLAYAVTTDTLEAWHRVHTRAAADTPPTRR
ncbi:hypothetical protein [Nocardia sp. NBC_01009]|uniref:hypothetical protein n=1 Tax=Nocardia sp. NBC_01009 TaxID=2975996 RepID=UPI00386ABC59|nr:hypothetical protein OHA42_17880 [Nocardia sp. NBC_01009]